jgi:hypothetical protein
MSIVAVVKDKDLTIKNIEVAAFIGEECRGVAKTMNDSLLFLTIAGEPSELAALTYKIYNAATGEEHEAPQADVYEDDAIHGTVQAPHIIQLQAQPQAGESIRVYPTKVKNILNVVSENGQTLSSITLYDATGSIAKRLDDLEGSYTTVDVSALTPGVYLVAVETTDGERAIVRIVK